jgi:hypothetical protein
VYVEGVVFAKAAGKLLRIGFGMGKDAGVGAGAVAGAGGGTGDGDGPAAETAGGFAGGRY